MYKDLISRRATLAGGILVAAVGAGLAGAAPAQADLDDSQVTANVRVLSGITLTGPTPNAFTLTGYPGDTVTTVGSTTYTNGILANVKTTNVTGYTLAVGSASTISDQLLPAGGTNPDTIAITALQVKGPTTSFAPVPVFADAPAVVDTKTTASAAAGDDIRTDFQITIPAVRPDTYTTVLNYIATENGP